MELRERLVRSVEGGLSVRKAAQQLMVDYTCGLKWIRQFRHTGCVQPKRQGGYRPCILLAHTQWLLNLLKSRPDLTLAEIREHLNQQGIRVGLATIWRFFRRHSISFKKSHARARTGSGRRRESTYRLAPPSSTDACRQTGFH